MSAVTEEANLLHRVKVGTLDGTVHHLLITKKQFGSFMRSPDPTATAYPLEAFAADLVPLGPASATKVLVLRTAIAFIEAEADFVDGAL